MPVPKEEYDQIMEIARVLRNALTAETRGKEITFRTVMFALGVFTHKVVVLSNNPDELAKDIHRVVLSANEAHRAEREKEQ